MPSALTSLTPSHPHPCGAPLTHRWKWQFVSLVEYEVVFFADLDVDLMPYELSQPAVRERWALMLPVFLGGRATVAVEPNAPQPADEMRLLGASDHSAPLNTGQVLVATTTTILLLLNVNCTCAAYCNYLKYCTPTTILLLCV